MIQFLAAAARATGAAAGRAVSAVGGGARAAARAFRPRGAGVPTTVIGPGGTPVVARTSDGGRPAVFDRLGNMLWAGGMARDFANKAFGLPTNTITVKVMAQGGPASDLRRTYWLALATAFGRVDLNDASRLPVEITAAWDVTEKAVAISLSYTVANLATAVSQVKGDKSWLTPIYRRLVHGPDARSRGGSFPSWMADLARSVGVSPQQKAAEDGTRLGPLYQLPEKDKPLLEPRKRYEGVDSVNPGPPVGDGVRTSLLMLVTASLGDPCDPLNTDPAARLQNQYNLAPTRIGGVPPHNPTVADHLL